MIYVHIHVFFLAREPSAVLRSGRIWRTETVAGVTEPEPPGHIACAHIFGHALWYQQASVLCPHILLCELAVDNCTGTPTVDLSRPSCLYSMECVDRKLTEIMHALTVQKNDLLCSHGGTDSSTYPLSASFMVSSQAPAMSGPATSTALYIPTRHAPGALAPVASTNPLGQTQGAYLSHGPAKSKHFFGANLTFHATPSPAPRARGIFSLHPLQPTDSLLVRGFRPFRDQLAHAIKHVAGHLKGGANGALELPVRGPLILFWQR